MKKVSVIVPCYNTAEYLPKCLESLVQQTIGSENIEIILVDDASTDEGATWKVIAEYEKRYPESILAIRLEENMRQGGARNIGISYANGEYLMFCDADDWLVLEAMEHLYHKAQEWKADIIQYRNDDVFDREKWQEKAQEGENSCLIDLTSYEEKKGLLYISKDNFSMGAIRKFYRTSLILEHQIKFAEKLICEEPAFSLPARLYANRFFFLDESLCYCYQHADSTCRGNWDNRKWDNMQVWIGIMEDMERRGAFLQYREELEYLFFTWGFGLTLQMLCQKGYVITEQEFATLQEVTANMVPKIAGNPYLELAKNSRNQLLFGIYNMEITKESVALANQLLRKYYVRR